METDRQGIFMIAQMKGDEKTRGSSIKQEANIMVEQYKTVEEEDEQ